jgi:NAD(P)-dependent dehydrogenase (short-subunit alcohol dehydrogenase family)/rhamnose utilization protein RhaD (predicted bifunctional aldolase and dehydrogenase)
MNKALADLIRISNITGKDSTLVQGGGGNTSVKTADGKYMYIKASGTALKDMSKRAGWRRVCLEPVLAIIKDKSVAKLDVNKREAEVVNKLLLACDDKHTTDARPSVEAHLHAILDKYVVHLHPLVIGAYVNSRNGPERFERLFENEKFPPLWVPYADPGFMLAKKITKLVADYQSRFGKKPAVLFLEKHGLIISADTAEAALRLVRRVISLCKSKLSQPKATRPKAPAREKIVDAQISIRKALFDTTGQYVPVSYFPISRPIAAFMARKDAARLLNTTSLNPDELVYANGPALWFEKCDVKTITKKLRALLDKGQKPSAAFLVKGLGLFIAADKKLAVVINEITTGSLLVRMRAAKFGGVLSLTTRQQNFINKWESEAFRKKLVCNSTDSQLQGRIAVVTGAGSGLGRSIAVGLARAGAVVGLLDIDVKSARQTSAIIEKELPKAQTTVVVCDVTDRADVDKILEALLESWGGLDVLVNAAGVAPAGSLVDMPVDKWRLALEVNLTGYFLLAKAAARIMIKQAVGGSIINISSKSGLEASKDNTAYNATKAGEIHMGRGWAIELGQYGIRVNCVCPGNVFEGSKIWNRQYFKVCAEKYGIKPEEVIPYYVNKTSLKQEIKGQDVADAVIFLCSDKARVITGQVLVVDGGQVMVR